MDEKYFMDRLKEAGISLDDIIKVDRAKRYKFYQEYRKIKLTEKKRADELAFDEEKHDFKQEYIGDMKKLYPDLAELQNVNHIQDIENLADKYNKKLAEMSKNGLNDIDDEYRELKERYEILNNIANEGRRQAANLDKSILMQSLDKAVIQRTLKELENSKKAESGLEDLKKNTPVKKELSKADKEISPIKR